MIRRLSILALMSACAIACGAFAAAKSIPVEIDTEFLADSSQVVVTADISGVFPLPQGAVLAARLSPVKEGVKLPRKVSAAAWPGLKKTRLRLDMTGLPAGEYAVSVTGVDEKTGSALTGTSSVRFMWPGPKGSTASDPGSSVMNNLVVQLLSESRLTGKAYSEYSFMNPCDGWVFFSATIARSGKVVIDLNTPDGKDALLISESPGTREAMRYLRTGRHTLGIRCAGNPTVSSLVVRTIPELIYSDFHDNPHVTEYGPYDWHFLQKYILHNANVMVTSSVLGSPLVAPNDITQIYGPYMRQWVRQGKKWIFHAGLPGTGVNTDAVLDEAYRYWSTHPGYTNPLASGIIVDEFPGASEDAKYKAWAGAVEKIYQDPTLGGRIYYGYTFGRPMHEKEPSRLFAETVLRHGGIFALEWYPTERPDEEGLDKDMDWWRNDVLTWRAGNPRAVRHLIANMGYMTCPAESLNIDPSVDFKVQMDMYMNWLANDPTFYGLYGLAWYKSAYADEEYVRWGSRLFRHYCIEGRTNLLSNELGYRYKLGHIQNPDFTQGLTGWNAAPAEEGSVGIKAAEGFGFLQGRNISRTDALGDTGLWTRRCAGGPNTISQRVSGLAPGKLYSAKMISGDYSGYTAGKTKQEKHAVSLEISDVDLVEDLSFQQVLANHPGRPYGEFDGANRFWMNYHIKVFRARGTTATLAISDWADGRSPGGPTGQEMIYNFVEVQPYYPE